MPSAVSQAGDDACRAVIAAGEPGQMHAAGAIPVKNGTCRRRRNTVPAWKKSAAGLVFAWTSKNARQHCARRDPPARPATHGLIRRS